MAILYGFGDLELTTTDLTTNVLLPIPGIEFEINADSDKKVARFYNKGEIQVAGSKVVERTYSIKLGIEAINWLQMQLAFGELAQTVASVALPELRYATVPSASPYEIEDADISTTDVLCTITTRGAWGEAGPLARVTEAPATRQFQVNTADDKLIFNAAQAGAIFAYRLFKTHSNLQAIGAGQVADVLDNFSFSGIGYGDEFQAGAKIVVPKLARASEPTLNIQDVTKLEIEFDLLTPPGKRKPYEIYAI
ncbi:hypothetical protein GS597_09220 [Synechococcales cyanobacterium C]|uniref:Uncharacterized protein n=1 Tax=Petrachloros mirabilis ULC683 TaxID=2781853 RepID=A0A8K1ZZ76_9CYAN|nr:hypothetical protein [Petrachloros mirabilis]NCJ06683.1 hypothetical protein [Petrachloros mirabilis ULC683]